MQDLKDVTQDQHYENYRAKKLASGESIEPAEKYVFFKNALYFFVLTVLP